MSDGYVSFATVVHGPLADGFVAFATVVHGPLADGFVSYATVVHDDTAVPAGGGDIPRPGAPGGGVLVGDVGAPPTVGGQSIGAYFDG